MLSNFSGTRLSCQRCASITRSTATRMSHTNLLFQVTMMLVVGLETANSIRYKKRYCKQVRQSEEELRKLNFCYEISIVERDWNEKILSALKIFRHVFDHCIVENHFKVPSEQPWPKEAWGMQLGNVVSGASYLEQATRDEDIFVQLGFTWDYHGSNWRDRVLPALEICAAEYGHFRHSQKFVVPCQDPWPKNVWGMGLGMQLYMMRYRGHYFPYIGRDADRLEALGFSFELRREPWVEKVKPLLETYETISGDREVPDDFIIPCGPRKCGECAQASSLLATRSS